MRRIAFFELLRVRHIQRKKSPSAGTLNTHQNASPIWGTRKSRRNKDIRNRWGTVYVVTVAVIRIGQVMIALAFGS